jgi:hypothetical protein
MSESQRVLHLFICGAGPASRITDMVALAHAEGWSVRDTERRAKTGRSDGEDRKVVPASLIRSTIHQV